MIVAGRFARLGLMRWLVGSDCVCAAAQQGSRVELPRRGCETSILQEVGRPDCSVFVLVIADGDPGRSQSRLSGEIDR